MKKNILILVLCCFGVFVQGQSKADKRQAKEEKAEQEYQKTKALVTSGSFEFEGDWVFPLGGNRISLIGNSNGLKIEKDNVEAFLPYFGVVRAGGVTYGGQGGIRFDGPLKDYKVIFNDVKRTITLDFDARNDRESFKVVFNITRGGGASVVVTGVYRNSIRYLGDIKPIEEKEG